MTWLLLGLYLIGALCTFGGLVYWDASSDEKSSVQDFACNMWVAFFWPVAVPIIAVLIVADSLGKDALAVKKQKAKDAKEQEEILKKEGLA